MQGIVNWLVQEQSTYVLCGFIALVFLVGLAWFQFPLIRATRRLSVLIAELESIESESAFVEAYGRLDSEFRTERLIQHQWSEFADSLVMPSTKERGEKRIRNTEPPELFFTSPAIAGSVVNLRLQTAFPNYLTGLGILGTFLGLSAGIVKAQSGLTSSDPTQVVGALQNLLGGAGVAFWTSVVGLSASMVASTADKFVLKGLDRRVERWNGHLERLLLRVTPEQVAIQHLEQSTNQTAQLERFNTELAVSIADALERKVAGAIGTKFDALIQGVSDLKGQQAAFAENVLASVADQLTTALNGAAGSEMKELAATVKEVSNSLKITAENLGSGHKEMTEATRDALADLVKAARSSSDSLSQSSREAVEAITGQLKSASEGMASNLSSAAESTAEKINTAGGDLGKMADRLVAASDQLIIALSSQEQIATSSRLVIQESAIAVEEFRKAGGAVSGALAQLTVATKSLQSAAEQVPQASGQILQAAQLLAESQSESVNLLQNQEARFRLIDEALGKCVSELVKGVESLSVEAAKFTTEFDKEMAKAVQGLAAVAKEISDAVEDLADGRARL